MSLQVPIALSDQMTAPLLKMSNAMNTVISSMEKVGGVSNSALRSAQNDMRSASAQLTGLQGQVERTSAPIARANKHANAFTGSLKSMVGMVGGLYAVQKAFGLINSSLASVQNRTQQETKLATIMKQRMGTSNIKGVTKTMTKQSKIGVIGTTNQMQGAQQMGTFLNQEKSLKTLIPAMNNLAVQQKGVNATGDDMKNIGNMVGKVMQGQTGALKRVGISFTSAQEKALKYGNEQKRAATLAKVIQSNVGNMNKEIAKTPQGQMQQMKNNLAGIKLQIGQAIMPAVFQLIKTVSKNIPAIKTMATGFAVVISGVAGALTGVANVAGKVITKLAGIFGKKADFKTMSATVAVLTKAFVIGAAALTVYKAVTFAAATATKVAAAAQKIFNFAVKDNPIVLIITIIIAFIAVLVVLQKKFKIFTKLGSLIGGFVGKAKTYLGSKWQSICSKASATASKFKAGVGKAFKSAGDKVAAFQKRHPAIFKAVKGYYSGMVNFVTGVFTGNWKKAWQGVVQIFKAIFGGLGAIAKAPINYLIGIINGLITRLDKLHVKMPKALGGKTLGFNIPKIPALAKGTSNWGGGLAQVNERGGEIIDLPGGSRVYPPTETRRMINNNKTSKKIVLNKLADKVVVNDEGDIDKIVDRLATKLELVMENM